jgi:hypothetical protein
MEDVRVSEDHSNCEFHRDPFSGVEKEMQMEPRAGSLEGEQDI